MTKRQYVVTFARRLLAILAAIAAIHLVLGIRPAFAAEPVANEYDHIRTTLHGEAGPVAVLIPGMSTPGAVWDDTVAALENDMRLLVVEVRGMEGARAPANEGPGVIVGIVADLSTDLAARSLPGAGIIGHSFGGLIALRFGLDHPAQASSLLVIDALPFFGTVLDEKASASSIRPRAEQMRDMMLAQADAIRAAGAAGTANPAAAAGMVLDEAQRSKVANWSLMADPAVVAQALYEDMQTDLRAEIATLEMPLTVLYQAETMPEMARERYATDYAALATARLVPVAGTSHFIMLDRPELVRAEIARIGER